MAEPIKVYRDGEEFVATSPTGLKQLQDEGWLTEEQAEAVVPTRIEEPAPKKRGRPKKTVE